MYRIANVSFLNSLPLVAWFEENKGLEVELLHALPSELSGLLDVKRVDVALLPVVEVMRGHSPGLVSSSGIACVGAVDSVKLFSSSELSQIKEVFTDRGSRTSVALLRVLFLELLGFCPEFRETNPDPQVELQPGQGILVIGDRCFQFDRLVSAKGNDRLQGYDLGELWHTMTGLPFVFAAWASAPGLVDKMGPSGIQELGALLDKARDYGLEHLEELAAASATAGKCGRGGDATSAAISYYFRRSLRYKIGESEWAGMQEFRRLCIKHSIVPSDCELVPV